MGKLGSTVADGAYHTMIERIQSDNNPNFFFLTYTKNWSVHDFVVIPKQFFTPEIILQRKPLAETARRAGWIGCNIDLSKVSDTGKVYLVKNEQIQDLEVVSKAFTRTLFLRETSKEAKGWILEMLACLQLIQKQEFTLDEMYRFESQLRTKFPENHHIKPKIRQQLQFLRDKGIIEFLGRGKYKKV
jgi:type II restriction enzyme